jgi:hypothetical protein
MTKHLMNWQKIGSVIFGGEGPRENERRYRANGELKYIADMAEPWTVEGLRAAVRDWLETREPE